LVFDNCGFRVDLFPAGHGQSDRRSVKRSVMTRKRLLLLVLPFALAGLFEAVKFFNGPGTTPSGQAPLTVFSSSDITPVKTAFNQAASSTRLLLMLTPT
jgi:hypothetical protein